MIGPQPKDYRPLKEPLRIEVSPRATVRFEDGVVTLYSRGNTVRMSEWEFDEIATTHAKKRIDEAVARHRKHKKK